MPRKLRLIFQKEYGKERGSRIFYAYENKHKGLVTIRGATRKHMFDAKKLKNQDYGLVAEARRNRLRIRHKNLFHY